MKKISFLIMIFLILSSGQAIVNFVVGNYENAYVSLSCFAVNLWAYFTLRKVK
jgi:hypothetical protein